MKKQIPRITTYQLTELQDGILSHVCKKKNTDYSSLIEKLGKNRITILQSINSLIKRGFVSGEKINSSQSKSKLIFWPTEKGICYSVAFLNLNVDDAIKLFGEEGELAKYRELIDTVGDYDSRAELMKNSCKFMLELNLFTNEGKSRVVDRKQLFQIGFVNALTSLTSDGKFEPREFFSNQTVDSLKKVLTESEIKEVSKYLSDLKDNINIIMNKLIKNFS